MKEILKFDAGAKGFERAAYILVALAFLMLILGAWFILTFQ